MLALPRGAGVGLLSLRRARAAAVRSFSLSRSPLHGRADVPAYDERSFSLSLFPRDAAIVIIGDGEAVPTAARAAFIEPISFPLTIRHLAPPACFRPWLSRCFTRTHPSSLLSQEPSLSLLRFVRPPVFLLPLSFIPVYLKRFATSPSSLHLACGPHPYINIARCLSMQQRGLHGCTCRRARSVLLRLADVTSQFADAETKSLKRACLHALRINQEPYIPTLFYL